MTKRDRPEGEERARVRVVVPAFREAAVIGDVVSGLRAEAWPVVVVDDGSGDETGERALEAGATVLRHAINRGQGAALQTGITHALRAGAEAVVTFDADGQHQVSDLPALVGPVLSGEADVALGSRFLDGRSEIPAGRRLLLAGAVVFSRFTSGVKLSDAHNGLRAFSRHAASQLDIRLDGMAHASEIIDQIQHAGLRHVEVPVHVRYTDYSRAKGQRASAAVRVAWDYLVEKLLP